MTTQTTTIGTLAVGTMINYYNMTVGDDSNYIVTEHYSSRWGAFTKLVNIETKEEKDMVQYTEIGDRWSIIATEILN